MIAYHPRVFLVVRPEGIEPPPLGSKPSTLSVELRAQIRTSHINLIFYTHLTNVISWFEC